MSPSKQNLDEDELFHLSLQKRNTQQQVDAEEPTPTLLDLLQKHNKTSNTSNTGELLRPFKLGNEALKLLARDLKCDTLT